MVRIIIHKTTIPVSHDMDVVKWYFKDTDTHLMIGPQQFYSRPVAQEVEEINELNEFDMWGGYMNFVVELSSMVDVYVNGKLYEAGLHHLDLTGPSIELVLAKNYPCDRITPGPFLDTRKFQERTVKFVLGMLWTDSDITCETLDLYQDILFEALQLCYESGISSLHNVFVFWIKRCAKDADKVLGVMYKYGYGRDLSDCYDRLVHQIKA